MAIYRLKRKNFAFGFSSLAKAFKGMTNSGQTARLQKIVDAGHGGMKMNGGTVSDMLAKNQELTKNVGSNLTKGALGLGATAAAGATGVGAYNVLTGNVGNDGN